VGPLYTLPVSVPNTRVIVKRIIKLALKFVAIDVKLGDNECKRGDDV
jgi:hypothetical protein